MAKTYLDETGLATLWGKIKGAISDIKAITGISSDYATDGIISGESANALRQQTTLSLRTHNNIIATSLGTGGGSGTTGTITAYLDLTVYGTCSTAAGTAAKVVNGADGFALNTGSIIAVKFMNTNTATVSGLTLNVNQTGAKSIKYRGGNISSTDTLAAGRIYWFIYDGTNYELIGDLDTAYPTMSQAEATAGTVTDARVITPLVLKTTIANMIGDAGGGGQMSIEDVTSTFSSSNSRIVVRKAYKCGNWIEMQLGLNRTAAMASNANVTGTLSGTYLPLLSVTGTSYVNANVVSCSIYGADGTSFNSATSESKGYVNIRNTGASNITASSGTYIIFNLRYIYDDGSLTS